MNLLVLTGAASAAVSALITWQLSSGHYLSTLQTERLAWQKSRSEALQKAAEETANLQRKKDEALKLAAARQSALARDAAGSRDALVRLSHAADRALRNAQDSHETCKLVAATGTELLQQCSSRYRTVAEEADRWVGEALTLRDAWPTASEQSQQP